MTTVQQLIQLLLLLVTLTQAKPGPEQAKPGPEQAKPGPEQAKPGPDQVCYTVVGTNRWNISTIYYTHKEDKNLYERVPLNTPLLNCTNTPVDLDTCRVCVLTERAEEQVVVVCLLTEPEAELLFEGGGQTLTTNHSACPAPPPPPPPAPAPDLGLMIGLPLGLLLLLLVLLLVLVGYFREKIKSCLKCRCQKFCEEGHTQVPKEDPQDGAQVNGDLQMN